MPPLDGAADRWELLRRALSALRDQAHRLDQLTLGPWRRFTLAALVEPAVVGEDAVLGNAVELGRADGIVGARDLLRLVEQVGKRKAVAGGEQFHVGRRVVWVFDGIV